MHIRRCLFSVILSLIAVSLCAIPAFSEVRWVEGTEAEELLSIVADPVRDRIYYGNGDTNQIVIVNSNTESIIGKLQVAGKPMMMDISKDSKKMAVAHRGLSIIDLETFSVTPLPVGKEVVDVAFDHSGDLYVTTMDYWGYVLKVDSVTGEILKSFGTGSALNRTIYKNALVETDASGFFLYVGERGLSPASIYKFSISGDTPVFLAEDVHGALGSNLQQITVHQNGQFVYVACGAPYYIQELDANTLNRVNALHTGAYPIAVVIDPSGTFAYAGANTQDYLFKFDLSTKALINKEAFLEARYNDDLQPRGLAVDRTGSKIFAIHGNTHPSYKHMQIQVLTNIPLTDSDSDGIPDNADNCPDDFNPGQEDQDDDSLGDVCDPFPTDNDNLGACIEENKAQVLDIDRLLEENNNLRTMLADDDNDGILNTSDYCSDTPYGDDVDISGCSHIEFCELYVNPSYCNAADWNNDNPINPMDCQWKYGTCILR